MTAPLLPGGLSAHPLADAFPMIEGEARAEFEADVARHDLRTPIVMLEGLILDGRNRYLAAVKEGIIAADVDWRAHPSQFRIFNPAVEGSPLDFVLSENLTGRRHLTPSQRAMIAARLANMRQGHRSDLARPAAGEELPAPVPEVGRDEEISQGEAAARTGVSERLVRQARKVQEQGTAELNAAVQAGSVPLKVAEQLADLPFDEQVEVLRRSADPRALSRLAKEARDEKTAEKKARRSEKERALGDRQRALPANKYGVILADPAWRFESYSRETGADRAADNHYPTSTLEEIKALGVADIADDDCVLFLWATAPMLPEAIEVMAAWGFAYKSQVIWRKAEIGGAEPHNQGRLDRGHYSAGLVLGTGYWFRNAHEILLVGTRGNLPAPAPGEQWPSVIDAAPLRHSEKPIRFHDLIEAYFPNLPKIELNARRARDGWDLWGNEAPPVEVGEPSPDARAQYDELAKLCLWPADGVKFVWDKMAVEVLEAGYAAQVDGREIAKVLGCSPGAVFGKANRLGLTDKARQLTGLRNQGGKPEAASESGSRFRGSAADPVKTGAAE